MMSKTTKILMGILTVFPIIYFFFFILIWFLSFFAATGRGNFDHISSIFGIVFVLHMMVMLLCLGLIIFYLIHCAKNPALDSNQRIMWILIIVFAGILGMVIYFYLNIWKVNPPDQTPPPFSPK